MRTKDTQTDTRNTCKGIGAWEGHSGMDHWCEISCHFTPPNCPKTHCFCAQENGFTTTLDSIITNTIPDLEDTSSLTITGTSSLILTTGPDGTTRVSGNTGAFGDTTDENEHTNNFENINIFGIDTTGIDLNTTVPDTLFVPDTFDGTTDTNTIFVTDDFGITDRSDTFDTEVPLVTTTTDFSEFTTTTQAPTTTSTTTNTSPPESKPRTCRGKGSWSHLNQWCNLNCNHTPPYCPTTHCICDDDQ